MKVVIKGVIRMWPFVKDEPYEFEMDASEASSWYNTDVIVKTVEVKK